MCRAQEMKIWVFIVGISEYEYFNNLNYADDDAIAFETLLKKTLGKYYNEEQTRILLNEEATSAAIESGMRWLLKNVKANDKVYFYFSGHGGFEDLTDFKLGYLHAYNAFNQTYSSGGNISLEFLQAFLQSLSAREVQTYFIADACHAGKSDGGKSGFIFLNNSLASETQNIYKLLSAQGNEKSYENAKWGGGHGAFTYYMIKGLMGFADTAPEDGLITLFEVERYLFENVPVQTQYLQNPKVVANRKDMYLAKVNQAEFEMYKELLGDDDHVNLLESLSKGTDMELLALLPDTAQHVHALFKQAINDNNLVAPARKNAFAYYSYMANNFQNNRILESMVEALYITIMNRSQQYLNTQLRSSEDRIDYKIDNLKMLHQAMDELLLIIKNDDPLHTKILVSHYYIDSEIRHWSFDIDEINKAEFKLALPGLLEAVKLDSNAAYLYYNIGALYYHIKEYDEGIKHSRKAIKLAPNWSIPYNNMGNIYNGKKNLDSAIYYYEKAVALAPKYTAAYSNLAREYLTVKPDDTDFEVKLDSAAKLYMKSTEYAFSLKGRNSYATMAAAAYYKLYEKTDSREYLAQGIEVLESLDSISEQLWILWDLEKYQTDYDKESPKSWITSARYYAATSKYKKAVKNLRWATELGTVDWDQFELYPEVQLFIKSEEYISFRDHLDQ